MLIYLVPAEHKHIFWMIIQPKSLCFLLSNTFPKPMHHIHQDTIKYQIGLSDTYDYDGEEVYVGIFGKLHPKSIKRFLKSQICHLHFEDVNFIYKNGIVKDVNYNVTTNCQLELSDDTAQLV